MHASSGVPELNLVCHFDTQLQFLGCSQQHEGEWEVGGV